MKRFQRFNSAARRLPPRPLRLLAAATMALAIAALIASVLGAVLMAGRAGSVLGGGPDLAHLLRMTAIQAGLTTVLSLAVGTALAWALNRLRFPGRGLVVALLASAIVTPGLVVAFGLLAVWGREGWVRTAFEGLGLDPQIQVFGLPGILFAHVILDGSFAARILLGRLDAIPARRLKTGRSLGLSALVRFLVIDWPALRGSLPGLAAIIFLLAFTSFPIVLLLGGGPANQTLEVAIYAAVRLDFDLASAVHLALAQIGVCAAIILLSAGLAPSAGLHGPASRVHWPDRGWVQGLQWAVAVAGTAAFGAPLLAVLAEGVGAGLSGLAARPSLWSGLVSSILIAVCSAMLTLALTLALALGRSATASRSLRVLLGVPAFTYLAVPGVVLSLGFFLLARQLGVIPDHAAPVVIVTANGLLSLPFALATLGPPLETLVRERGRLIRSLNISGTRQFLRLELPLVGREIGLVLALAFCFSLGDLSVIALFGTEDFATLPLLMLRALGAYRTSEAAGLACLLLVMTTTAFLLFPHALERLARAAR